MRKIKEFLKRDSNILRNIILLLIGLIVGLNKLVFDHRFLSTVFGLFLIAASILIFVDIIKEMKRLKK